MKIEKKALISALKKAQKFTGKALPILANVLIDGENQLIVATDLTTRFETPLTIKDYEQTVAPAAVEMTDDLREQFEDLKKDQLVSMAEYAGASTSGKKSDIIDRLMSAAEKASAAETAMTKDLMFKESFCADPRKLCKIVESLELDGSDMVPLMPEVSAEINRGLFEAEVKATRLSVGEHFKSLEIMPADEFPEWFDVLGAEPVATVTGKSLMSIVNVCASIPEKDQRSHTECLFFDGAHNMVVSTDGNRLHALQVDVNLVGKGIPIDFRAMRSIGQLAGKEDVSISYDPNVCFAVLKYGGDTVTVRVDTDTEFPDYKDILDSDGQTVEIERAKFVKMLKQAVLVTNLDYKAVTLTFNGGLDASVENPDEGAYHRESIDIDGVVDPEITVNLNPRFIMDALGSSTEENVAIRVSGEDRAVHVLSEKFQATIMPLRV